MATMTNTRATGATLADRWNALRKQMAAASAQRKVYNTTLRELSVLTDRELADLGIARSQIKGIAMEAAYGAGH